MQAAGEVEAGGDEEEIPWEFRDDHVELSPFHYTFHAFAHYERFGSFPDGRPWDEQPLSLLAAFEAIRVIRRTMRIMEDEERWDELTDLTAEIYRYVEGKGKYGS